VLWQNVRNRLVVEPREEFVDVRTGTYFARRELRLALAFLEPLGRVGLSRCAFLTDRANPGGATLAGQ
jgi:hypothetical protein